MKKIVLAAIAIAVVAAAGCKSSGGCDDCSPGYPGTEAWWK